MQIDFTYNATDLQHADLVVLPIQDGTVPSDWQDRPGLDRAIADAIETKEATPFYQAEGAPWVLVAADGEAESQRNAGAKAAVLAQSRKVETVALVAPDGGDPAPFVEGFRLGAYRYTRYKTTEEASWAGPSRLLVLGGADYKGAVEEAAIRAEATVLARDLVNRSPDETTAQGLGALAKEAGEAVGLTVSVWDKAAIEAEGMGGLLSVNRGSVDPPAFITMEHHPDGAVNEKPVVLVGKAVTFDTGGLSLKPTKGSMDHMKADMAGGAAVIGAMVGIARMALPLHVVALVPSTDNRPGLNAFVPGDVVRMHNGTTVEVLNTDAEGRMLLADALSYARRYDPHLVVDVATLTGAAVVALGDRVAAVFTSDTEDAPGRYDHFVDAGNVSGDRVWPMPVFELYREQLKSDVADLKNVGGREAGSCTAAAFLEHFTQDGEGNGYPWVHLDIAGPAFRDSASGYLPSGGTGFGVRLLMEALRQVAADSHDS